MSSAAGYGDDHKSMMEVVHETRTTLNDLPIPSGSWQEQYNQRNSKWNMLLGASVVVFVCSVTVVSSSSHNWPFILQDGNRDVLQMQVYIGWYFEGTRLALFDYSTHTDFGVYKCTNVVSVQCVEFPKSGDFPQILTNFSELTSL